MIEIKVTFATLAEAQAFLAAQGGKQEAVVAQTEAPAPAPKARGSSRQAPAPAPTPAAPDTASAAGDETASEQEQPGDDEVSYAQLQAKVLELHKIDPAAAVKVRDALGLKSFKDLTPADKAAERVAAMAAVAAELDALNVA